MDWFSQSHLFNLARQGKRLTHILAVIPLAFLFLFLSEFGALPVLIAVGFKYGFTLDVLSMTGLPVSAALSGLWMRLFLVSAFFLMYIFVMLWARLFEKRPFWTLGYERKDALMRYGRGFLFGGLMFAGAVAILAAFGQVTFEQGDPSMQGLAALGGVSFVLVGWIVQGGAEEVVTRGWVLPVLGARYRPWVGVIVSTLIFASMHSFNEHLSILALVNLALFGLFAALYALREGSLWGVSALHAAWNWVQGNFFGFEVSGMSAGGGTLLNLKGTGPDWMTGGSFGPEGGLAVTLMLILALGLVLFWRSKTPASS